ncbi:MAG: A/G-specific adenine glycosylase [Elusimicrobiota bacterium]
MENKAGRRASRSPHAGRQRRPQQSSDPRVGPLLAWYDRTKRDLPWRKNVSAYSTWISEIMLQQTTVAAASPAFKRFLVRFPGIRSLAGASEQDVLLHWAGLGYYSRARNLLRAARKIMEEHGGKFPSEPEKILALPGIGRYTAGAIASIAFGLRVPLVDGNVARVFSRWFAVREDIKNPKIVKAFWNHAERMVPPQRPGDWNQALMELGATVCLPEKPRCALCPVQKNCAAQSHGIQDSLPILPARRAAKNVRWTCLWIENSGRVLLWKRSGEERFLKDLWGFPEARHLAAVAPGKIISRTSHSITNHRITVDLRACGAPREIPPSAEWIPKSDLKNRLVSSLWRKLLPRAV